MSVVLFFFVRESEKIGIYNLRPHKSTMFGATCGIVVLSLLLLNSIIPTCGQSPCPSMFRYMRDEDTGEIMGRIQIQGAPRNVALHLRITLSVATALPTKYVGRLELATSRSEAVRDVQQGRPLVYRIYFPLRHPIPLLTQIMFNGQRYCTGSRASGPVVTSIFLEHTLYPPGVVALSDDNRLPGRTDDLISNRPLRPGVNDIAPVPPEPKLLPDSNLIPIFRPGSKIPTYINIAPPTEQPPPEFPTPAQDTYPANPDFNSPSKKKGENCGRSTTGGVNYLIAHGGRTTPGQWPWLAAIFIAKIKFEFQCGGNLITDRHVLTAAHCKISNDVEVPASAFLVVLGRYHLRDWRETGSKMLEVLEFKSHPEYKSRTSADADLAIIRLRDRVQFTPKIQPLCLWSGPIGLDNVVGLNGYVVGWGRDEHGNQHLTEPRMAQTPIVSQEDCLRSNFAFLPSTSNRTLCAGRRDGSGPCNGDSGSGLVILDPKTERYHLRGIVSLSLLDKTTLSCDLSQYVVYSDTAKYLDWIKSEINN